jgi:hypothetical protein
MDEQHQQQQQHQQHQQQQQSLPRSAPADLEHDAHSNRVGVASIKKKSTGGINAVRNLKKQQGPPPQCQSQKRGDFSVVENSEADMRRNPLNFDDLVSNFQNGTTLERLKRELAESQRSLSQSETVIRDLSGQYLNPKHKAYK